MIRALIPVAVALAAAPLMAQEVQPCDWQASVQAIPEPWEAHTRTFANGAVRLAALDTVEPAQGFAWLLVLSPPLNELGERQCRVIGAAAGLGFAGLNFAALQAGYDPATGLVIDLPVTIVDPASALTETRGLQVTVNQATGAVAARLEAAQ